MISTFREHTEESSKKIKQLLRSRTLCNNYRELLPQEVRVESQIVFLPNIGTCGFTVYIPTLIKEVFLKILNGKPVSFNFFTIVIDLSKSSTTPVAAIRKSGWNTHRWETLLNIYLPNSEEIISLIQFHCFLEFQFRTCNLYRTTAAWQMQIDLIQTSWGAADITLLPFTNEIFRTAILITLEAI